MTISNCFLRVKWNDVEWKGFNRESIAQIYIFILFSLLIISFLGGSGAGEGDWCQFVQHGTEGQCTGPQQLCNLHAHCTHIVQY